MGQLLLITNFVLGRSNPFLNVCFELCGGEKAAAPNGRAIPELGARVVRFLQERRADGKAIPAPPWNNPAGLANTNYQHLQIPNRNRRSERCSSLSVEKTWIFISVNFTCGFKEVTQPVQN